MNVCLKSDSNPDLVIYCASSTLPGKTNDGRNLSFKVYFTQANSTPGIFQCSTTKKYSNLVHRFNYRKTMNNVDTDIDVMIDICATSGGGGAGW